MRKTHSGMNSTSLLNKMAGSPAVSDEDELMLKHILSEIGGTELNGLSIKQAFLLTLEQLKDMKKLRKDHEGM